VYNDEMKLIILKIGKLVTGCQSLITIGLGLAITFAIGTAIEMLMCEQLYRLMVAQTHLSFEHIFSNDIV
jgi:hypothetical protein